uniref:Uncharacterized protein n=1 Tax=Glossina pallidipes TaxID=7398 RepID=A0A1B0AE42_GLOPL
MLKYCCNSPLANITHGKAFHFSNRTCYADLVDLCTSSRSAGSLLNHNKIFPPFKVKNFMLMACDKCKLFDVAFRRRKVKTLEPT